MSGRVVARTAILPEELTALVRQADGTLQPVPVGTADARQPQDGPAFPPGVAAMPPSPSWMDRESILPGFKNSTVALGVGLVAVALYLATKPKRQVYA